VTDGTVPGFMELYGPEGVQKGGLVSFAASLVPLAIMGALIAQRGQSLGKIVMLTRIVTLDGRRASLYHGFVLRTLPITGLARIPSLLAALGSAPATVKPLTLLTGLVSLVDVLFIFGKEHRCLHDQIAGTAVATLGTERPAHEHEQPPRTKKRKKRKMPAEGEAG
ncbi:MAG: RDD family protein, partial [Myxococcales bacterium]